MLRQHHVKIQDLVNYLRGYDPAKTQSAEDWSKQESSGFEPGMLIFCLERVSAPSGLAFGKKKVKAKLIVSRIFALSSVATTTVRW